MAKINPRGNRNTPAAKAAAKLAAEKRAAEKAAAKATAARKPILSGSNPSSTKRPIPHTPSPARAPAIHTPSPARAPAIHTPAPARAPTTTATAGAIPTPAASPQKPESAVQATIRKMKKLKGWKKAAAYVGVAAVIPGGSLPVGAAIINENFPQIKQGFQRWKSRNKPKIFVDLDSTLFSSAGDEVFEAAQKRHPGNIVDALADYTRGMKGTPGLSELDVDKGLVHNLEFWKSKGFEVNLYTSRSPHMQEITEANLKHHGLEDLFTQKIYGGTEEGTSRKVEEIRKHKNVAMVIDDAPANLPFNNETKGDPRSRIVEGGQVVKGSRPSYIQVTEYGEQQISKLSRIKYDYISGKSGSELYFPVGGEVTRAEADAAFKANRGAALGVPPSAPATAIPTPAAPAGAIPTPAAPAGAIPTPAPTPAAAGAIPTPAAPTSATPGSPVGTIFPAESKYSPGTTVRSPFSTEMHLDTETTKLPGGSKTHAITSSGVIHEIRDSGSTRGDTPAERNRPGQITQSASEIISIDGAGDRTSTNRKTNIHLDKLDLAGTGIDSTKIKIEYERPAAISGEDLPHKVIGNEQLARFYKEAEGGGFNDTSDLAKAVREEIGAQRGKFQVKDPEVLRKITANLMNNPPSGAYAVAVAKIGSPLNIGFGKQLFMERHGAKVRQVSVASSTDMIDRFLAEAESLNSRGGKKAAVAWNMKFDMGAYARHIDTLTSHTDATIRQKGGEYAIRFKTVFGIDRTGYHDPFSSGTMANDVIHLADASDKMKDVQFWMMVRDENFNVSNLNQEQIRENLAKGVHNRDEIKSLIQQGIETGETTQYLNQGHRGNRGGLHSLAKNVRDYTSQDLNKIQGDFLERAFPSQNIRTASTDEEKIVKQAATMVRDLTELDRSSGQTSLDVIRRNTAGIRHLDIAEKTLDRIFGAGGGSSIMGPSYESDLKWTKSGSLERDTLKFLQNYATGFELKGGNSLTAAGGIGRSLMFATDAYITTHHPGISKAEYITNKGGDSLHGLISDVIALDDKFVKQIAHDASIDIDQQMSYVFDMFNKHLSNPHGAQTEMHEFIRNMVNDSKLRSAENTLDQIILAGDAERWSGGFPRYIPEPHVTASRATGETIGDVARSQFGETMGGIKRKGGVLAAGIFTLSGLVLLGNRNGDIKHPGSKYNTLEGMSPSGDTLLHSFGSGNDYFASQAIAEIKYGSGYGSNTIRSSMLGYRGDRLKDILLGRSSFDDYTKSSEKGTLVHKVIESEYLKRGIAQASEHVVHDSELDIMGHIDLILKSGVPLEIKSVADFDALKELKYPKKAHVSQANFYAYALKQPYALIGYAARNDPTKVKYFKINVNLSKVVEDSRAVKAMMKDLRRQGHEIKNYSMYQAASDAIGRATQSKYMQNAVGQGSGVPSGMLPGPDHSAIKSFGDYGTLIKKALWRQGKKVNSTNQLKYTSGSGIRDQGSRNASMHSNRSMIYNGPTTHANGSRRKGNW